jgi:hypothetical protein
MAYIATGLAGFGSVVAAVSGKTGTLSETVVATVAVGVLGFIAVHESFVASDPPDPNWRTIAKARPTVVSRVPPGSFLSSAGTEALNRILRQTATVDGLDYAIYVSNNRQSSALAAHSSYWVKRQTAAMGHFGIEAAQAITQLVTLIQQSKATLSVPFPGLTPTKVKRALNYVRAHGLPKTLLNLAKRYRIPTSLLSTIKRRVKTGAALPSYATSIYGILSNPSFINAARAEANALQAYGQLLLAKG